MTFSSLSQFKTRVGYIFRIINEILKSQEKINFDKFLIEYIEIFDSLDHEKDTLLHVSVLAQYCDIIGPFAKDFFSIHIPLNLELSQSSMDKLRITINTLRIISWLQYFQPFIMDRLIEAFQNQVIIPVKCYTLTEFNTSRQKWINLHLIRLLDVICCVDWIPIIDSFTTMHIINYRIEHIYEIIQDFPDSFPAVNDLINSKIDISDIRIKLQEKCGEIYQQLSKQSQSITGCMEIIRFYIKASAIFFFLDPSGLTSQLILYPINQTYLKRSSFTMRNVAELVLDLSRQGLLVIIDEFMTRSRINRSKDQNHSIADNSFWLKEFQSFQPDPIQDAPIVVIEYFKQGNIYMEILDCCKSKMFFYEEVHKKFGQTLLSCFHGDNVEKHERLISFLEDKYGHSNFQVCRVMLRDVKESKTFLLNDSHDSFNPVILSYLHWQGTLSIGINHNAQLSHIESFNLPKMIQKRLDTVRSTFEKLCKSRTIEWISNMGYVDLEIERSLHDGRTIIITLECLSPLEASVILFISESQRNATKKEIMQFIGISIDDLNIVLERLCCNCSIPGWKVLSIDVSEPCNHALISSQDLYSVI